jgi:hypothetical protein
MRIRNKEYWTALRGLEAMRRKMIKDGYPRQRTMGKLLLVMHLARLPPRRRRAYADAR